MARRSREEQLRCQRERMRKLRAERKAASTDEAGKPTPETGKPPPEPEGHTGGYVSAEGENLSAASDTDALRNAKTYEEILSLRQRRETEAGKLAPVAETRAFWISKLNALKSALDAFPARLKMRVADLTPEHMAAVRECLDEVLESIK